ncbi:hypothetical protein ACQRBF_05975 [Peptoniphilaceae bacterium SGI.131]
MNTKFKSRILTLLLVFVMLFTTIVSHGKHSLASDFVEPEKNVVEQDDVKDKEEKKSTDGAFSENQETVSLSEEKGKNEPSSMVKDDAQETEENFGEGRKMLKTSLKMVL